MLFPATGYLRLLVALFAIHGPVLALDLMPGASPTPFTRLTYAAGRASELVMQAFGLLGIHYKTGGDSPENGFDRSGLVRHVFKQAWDTDLPRTSEELSRLGHDVDAKDLEPGDLVFYDTFKQDLSHVGIYLDDKKCIHSPSSGGQVRIESMNMHYGRKRFNGARRIQAPDAD